MKTKAVVVALVFWFCSIIIGGGWGSLETYMNGRPTASEVELQKLQMLYSERNFGDVVKECHDVEHDDSYLACRAQVLYIHWMACRSSGDQQQSYEIGRQFLFHYPEHELGIEMRFEYAKTMIDESRYGDALREIDYIQAHYPAADITWEMRLMRTQLAEMLVSR